MSDTPMTEVRFPKWQCHKQVNADKIKAIDPTPENAPEGKMVTCEQGAIFMVTSEWDEKHQPQIGGYLVVYGDDYRSYSPASAFEDGYTLIPDAAPEEEKPAEA